VTIHFPLELEPTHQALGLFFQIMAETTHKPDRSMVPHKYSFDATLKRSIPVTEPEAQVRMIFNTIDGVTFRKTFAHESSIVAGGMPLPLFLSTPSHHLYLLYE
jgi:hypothetical protein